MEVYAPHGPRARCFCSRVARRRSAGPQRCDLFLTLFPPRPLPTLPTQQEATLFPKSSGNFSRKTTIFHLRQF